MKLELTKREVTIVVFFLSLLVLGATIHLMRSKGNWMEKPVPVLKK